MSIVKSFFTLLLLLLTVQVYGQKQTFRPEPSFNSQPDTTSRYFDGKSMNGRGYKYIIEYTENGWVKVMREKYVEKRDKNGKFLGGKYVDVPEYIDLESLNPYVLKEEKEIHLLSKQKTNSPIVLSIEATMNGFLGEDGHLQTFGTLPENHKRYKTHTIYSLHYNIISSTKNEWILLCAVVTLHPRSKPYSEMDEKEKEGYVEHLRTLKSINDTIYGYINRQSFLANMELLPVYIPSLNEKFSDFKNDLINDIEDVVVFRMNLKNNFPTWILILLGFNVFVILFLGSFPKVQFFLDYCSLLSVFMLEVIFIVLLKADFWWCSPDQIGWIKAILFFLLSLALSIYQFFRFFNIVNKIKEKSKRFNTSIATILLAIVVVMILINDFVDGMIDQKLINLLIGTQILQVVISTIQLRKYPLYALMVLLLFPIGTFGILLTFMRLFAFLCFFGLLAFVFYCWASSSTDSNGKKSYQFGANDSTITDSSGNVYDRIGDADLSDSETVNYRGNKYRRRY